MTQCTMAAMLLAVLVGWVLAADPGGPAPSTGPYGGAGPVLWYRQPAAKWEQALPIGNGRMGAMVFGGMADERIQFNEDTLWTGRPHEYQHEGAVKFLPRIRQLLQEMRQFEAEGKPKEAGAKQREAEDLAGKEFMSVPLHQKAYQPFGDLRIKFPGHEAAARREAVPPVTRYLDRNFAIGAPSGAYYIVGHVERSVATDMRRNRL